MTNRIPVNPSMLKWARETAGFSLEDVTANKRFKNLSDLEKGALNPTYGQLQDLAQKYRRPLAIFFFPSPPQEETIKGSLRSLDSSSIEKLDPHVQFLFKKAKAFQLNLFELSEGRTGFQRDKMQWLDKIPETDSIDLISKLVRKQLTVSIQEQENFKSIDDAIRHWRNILAENGIFVFKEAFKDNNISGFCIYDNLFPIVFVNNSLSKSRQLFTIFHELAHIIFKQSYLDIFDEDFWNLESSDPSHTEVKCNAFAGEFLVPSEDFTQRFKDIPINEKNIEGISKIYSVSREVILRKYLNIGKIDSLKYQRMIQEWENAYLAHKVSEYEASNSSIGNYYNTQIAYLGDPYISLVLSKFYGGIISLEEASTYLGIKPKSFNSIEEKFMARVS